MGRNRNSGASDLVDFTLDIKHETEFALLVSDGDTDFWLPKSKIQYERRPPGAVEITMPEWLAKDKGLI